MHSNDHSSLVTAFTRRWRTNQRGGFPARLDRWRIVHWLLVQKLGFHRWVRAPLFFGERMWVLTGETTSSGLLAFGYAETALTALMLEVLKPGMFVVDVGAHLGYEALLACVLVGENGRVVSFEPQKEIASWTARNLRKFPQGQVIGSAVGDFIGNLKFLEHDILHSAFSGPASGEGGRQIQVPVTMLTAVPIVTERRVDLLKCDVEGAEMSVLRGAVEILKRDQPLLVLEAAMPSAIDFGHRVDEFDKFLAPLGYAGFSFDFDGRLKIGRPGELVVGHANVGFAPLLRPEFRALLPA